MNYENSYITNQHAAAMQYPNITNANMKVVR